jgi:uncharacterized membrane protein YbhN (UPF0104 family)
MTQLLLGSSASVTVLRSVAYPGLVRAMRISRYSMLPVEVTFAPGLFTLFKTLPTCFIYAAILLPFRGVVEPSDNVKRILFRIRV